MRVVGWILIAVLMLSAGCDDEAGTTVAMRETREHSNGLSVPVPEGFGARETDAGFELEETGQLRSPRTIAVRVAAQPPDPDTDVEARTSGGTTASYILRDLGSYSGGTEYELIAWRPAGNVWIVMTANEQAEHEIPDFAAPWAVLSQATIR